jgi:nicotinate-nucleotide--dimethylbenzimidazole phosphoribosyltransferase
VTDLDGLLAEVAAVGPLDAAAMAAAQAHLDRLTKPPGSLGRLEELVVQVAGITGRPAPELDRAAIVVAAADHGVARRGVSAYPPDVTAQMVANFVAGGAAINALAAAIDAEVVVLDVGVAGGGAAGGVASAPTGARLVRRPIRDGTADMTEGPAMTRDEAIAAIGTGLDLARELAAAGVGLLGVGEMGIGNTTAASALASVLTGFPPDAVTGHGTGVDDGGRARKVAAIELAIEVNAPDRRDPLGVLATVGGLEIAALTGVILGAVAARVPVVLDGFITASAALVACALSPGIGDRLIAGHRSPEPGHAIVLQRLGLHPLLELELRLGEGSGAALAMGLVRAAVRIRDGMATFGDAGVSGPAQRGTDARS